MRKYNIITIGLLILLAIRAVSLLYRIIFRQLPLSLKSIAIIFCLLYLVAFVGILKKQKWASILTIVAGIGEAAFAYITLSQQVVLSQKIELLLIPILGSLLLIALAYKEYKQISKTSV